MQNMHLHRGKSIKKLDKEAINTLTRKNNKQGIQSHTGVNIIS
jgi:hypothetical protein